MASPPTQHYVDPSIAANSGTGTIGDPYGDLQYALNQTTHDATDGDQFNIKAGTSESLAARLTLATYGSPTIGHPLILRGYTSAADDGGTGVIDCQGDQLFVAKYSGIVLTDLEVHNGNTSGNPFVWLDNYSAAIRCYIHDCGVTGLSLNGAGGVAVGNRVENCSNSGIQLDNYGRAIANYIKQGASRTMAYAIRQDGIGCSAIDNIISIDSTTDGIFNSGESYPIIHGNTILSNGGTGQGIYLNGNGHRGVSVVNNYVEGFSGVGGIGYQYNTASVGYGVRGFNIAYNNTSNLTATDETIMVLDTDPEILTASGLAKSGADTYANRLTYFAPVSEGGMQDGGMQPGGFAG